MQSCYKIAMQYKCSSKSAASWSKIVTQLHCNWPAFPNSDARPFPSISYQFGFISLDLTTLMTRPKAKTSEDTICNAEKLLAAMDAYRINSNSQSELLPNSLMFLIQLFKIRSMGLSLVLRRWVHDVDLALLRLGYWLTMLLKCKSFTFLSLLRTSDLKLNISGTQKTRWLRLEVTP